MKKICIKKNIFENDSYGLIPGVGKVRPAGQQACSGSTMCLARVPDFADPCLIRNT